MGKITEAIKALFTRNTTNAASVSGARVPFVQQDGTPIGNDSLANLASVLGGVYMLAKVMNFRVNETSTGNLDNLLGGIIYSANPSALDNAPSDIADGPCIFVFLGLGSALRGVQIGLSCSNGGTMKIYMRGCIYSGWTAWKSVALT